MPALQFTLHSLLFTLYSLRFTLYYKSEAEHNPLSLPCRPQPEFQEQSAEAPLSLTFTSMNVLVTPSPLTVNITDKNQKTIQNLTFQPESGDIRFIMGTQPLLGLGGGGLDYDRRGGYESMEKGHRSGEYQIHGSRVPVPLLIGTEGWAVFFHRPYNGAFDLRGSEGLYIPRRSTAEEKEKPLPLDLFIIRAESPEKIPAEYARLTGHPAMPPRWSMGYFQSHRTLEGPEEVIRVAETFREKNLPCDGLIYLGTGYCPAGWNIGHGTITFNPKTFPRPKEIIDRLHSLNFHIALHVNRPPVNLHGHIQDEADESAGIAHAHNYWEKHIPAFTLGVDGWWPDDGDVLPVDSRLTRHKLYYEGSLETRPGERPFSLHRTGYAGMQRFGGRVWHTRLPWGWNTGKSICPRDFGMITGPTALFPDANLSPVMSICPLCRCMSRPAPFCRWGRLSNLQGSPSASL